MRKLRTKAYSRFPGGSFQAGKKFSYPAIKYSGRKIRSEKSGDHITGAVPQLRYSMERNRRGGDEMKRKIIMGLASLALFACSSMQSSPNASLNRKLIRAAEEGRTEEVIALLKAGADIEAHDD